MDKEFISWGFFKFYPNKKKKTIRYKQDSFWATIDIDKQIVDYYFKMLKKENPHLNLKKPDRKAHITICKGEKLRNFRNEAKYFASNLRKLETKCITFTYNNKIETNGTHFFIRIKSREIENFRKYLGLSPKLKHEFHITIAKII